MTFLFVRLLVQLLLQSLIVLELHLAFDLFEFQLGFFHLLLFQPLSEFDFLLFLFQIGLVKLGFPGVEKRPEHVDLVVQFLQLVPKGAVLSLRLVQVDGVSHVFRQTPVLVIFPRVDLFWFFLAFFIGMGRRSLGFVLIWRGIRIVFSKHILVFFDVAVFFFEADVGFLEQLHEGVIRFDV